MTDVFRLLLRIYPRRFRDRFGDEMIAFHRERQRLSDANGRRSTTLLLWLGALADIMRSAPVIWWQAIVDTDPSALADESSHNPRPTDTMDALAQDLRFALRSMRRRPGFALVAILTLALGIGANTAIFSVVHAALLRQLPWRDAQRIVLVYPVHEGNRGGGVYLDYLDWRAQNTSFAELGVIRGQSVNLTGGETPERVIGSFVNSAAFRTLGASVARGRLFTDVETEVATRAPVAVISDAFWHARLGARDDALGSTVVLNGTPCTIVGIMRPDFVEAMGRTDVWMPIGYYPNAGDLDRRGQQGVLVIGRLRAGVTAAAAQRDLNAVAARIAAAYPTTNAGVSTLVRPLPDELTADARTPLLLVLSAVIGVLLIACANLANLLLVRAASRRRELSVRAALGAPRLRLIRQLVTESALLALAGGALGLVVAWVVVPMLARALPGDLPLYGPVRIEPPILAFAGLLTFVVAALFGGLPAIAASRMRVQDALTTRGSSTDRAGTAGRRVLVSAQLALSVVLLVAAGLLTRSLVALGDVRPGFDAERLLTLQFRLPVTQYRTEAQIAAMFERTLAEIRGVPGVRSAALVRATPLAGNGGFVSYAVGGAAADARHQQTAQFNIVSDRYFETMKIARIAGRDFTAADRAGTQPVAIVNDVLAARAWPRESALGKQIRFDADSGPAAVVIGVVSTTKHSTLAEPAAEQAYVPFRQKPLVFTEVVVRTVGAPLALATPVREAIWRVDRNQPVWAVRDMAQVVERARGGPRLTVGLMSAFGILALLLSTIGVYGVTSYTVAGRTREVGIRIALGARRGEVLGMVLREGMRTIAVAVAVGLVVSVVAGRLIASQLYGVGTADPLTLVGAAVALSVVALAAVWVPARRASRVDPLVALRNE